jgi:release factor glutamine methyltransferase
VTLAQWLRAASDRLAAAGIPAAEVRAEVRQLARHGLGWSRERLVIDAHRDLEASSEAVLDALCRRRERREPLAYIAGEREFFGRVFRVTPEVLIPRPETELLVAEALERLDAGGRTERARVVDIGTGSGCIAISVALALPGCFVDATDVSALALSVAHANAVRLGAAVTFYEGDLFGALPTGRRYDVILSNPPYIAPWEASSLAPEVALFEPSGALFDEGGDGLTFYRRLAQRAPVWLTPGGWLLVEVGAGQATEVERLWAGAGLRNVRSLADLAGIERVILGQK